MKSAVSLDETVDAVEVSTYRVPTDSDESDGTMQWDHTGVVVVQVGAAGFLGMGWSYAPRAAAELITDLLRDLVIGRSPSDIHGIWQEMNRHLRNAGRPGAGMMAVAAVDVALWDLKARMLDVPLVNLFGAASEGVDIYGSGGFTSYDDVQLTRQLSGWAEEGIPRVKMKVGRDAGDDPRRVRVARKAIGSDVELFVDANGGYERKQALALARQFAEESRVTWFEEPRSSDDLEGLRLMRDRGPAGMEIAAGEYGDTLVYFRRILEAGAVDCLQADATRCGGYTGFLKVAALCEAFEMPLSAHCAPQLHCHVGCAVSGLRHVEYFHDHVRIARLLFDGALEPLHGKLFPDRTRAGHGMALKSDAAQFRV